MSNINVLAIDCVDPSVQLTESEGCGNLWFLLSFGNSRLAEFLEELSNSK